jgi:hypothetical protein
MSGGLTFILNYPDWLITYPKETREEVLNTED